MPFYLAVLTVQRICELKNIYCCIIFRSKKLEAISVSIAVDLRDHHQMDNYPVLENNEMTICSDLERVVSLHTCLIMFVCE